MTAACVNPADLSGSGGELRSYFSTGGRTFGSTTPPRSWLKSGAAIGTPWVALPGLVTGRCSANESATYLEISVHGDPSGPRTDDIAGDLSRDWGLHPVDVDLALGNLIEIVGRQSKAWLGTQARGRNTLRSVLRSGRPRNFASKLLSSITPGRREFQTKPPRPARRRCTSLPYRSASPDAGPFRLRAFRSSANRTCRTDVRSIWSLRSH